MSRQGTESKEQEEYGRKGGHSVVVSLQGCRCRAACKHVAVKDLGHISQEELAVERKFNRRGAIET
ncbi:MAG: hypothetical protein N2V74_07420 [Candidatus Methanospirare jalkutatii]|nr:MAG: hypothetical protein N2V74_07420 [Candidatus Methanospirare jalkutatii]